MLDITSKSTYSNPITMEDLAEVAKTTTVGTDNINPEPVSLYIKLKSSPEPPEPLTIAL